MALLWLATTTSVILFAHNNVFCYASSKSSSSSSASAEETVMESQLFPFFPFECPENLNEYTYETTFRFLDGLGLGFIHVEGERIYFEYYFPSQHWVGFASADQTINGEQDDCTQCYFAHHTSPNKIYPLCVEECLDYSIFVSSVNYDEVNINNWALIEYQIHPQNSAKLQQTMYRIPPLPEVFEVWGDTDYPYRLNARFDIETVDILGQTYVHGHFWRPYVFEPSASLDEYDDSNKWEPFTSSLGGASLKYDDSICIMSIASYYGGEYPYDNDAIEKLPGFYVDVDNFANIHCFKLDNVRRDCGQDWSWLAETENENAIANNENENEKQLELESETKQEIIENGGGESDIKKEEKLLISEEATANANNNNGPSPKPTSSPSIQPVHLDDCCSAISRIRYSEINCLNISKSNDYIREMESKWNHAKCGSHPKNLPSDLVVASNRDMSDYNECESVWALMTQIHNVCYKYKFASKSMSVFSHFKDKGTFECFGDMLTCADRLAAESGGVDVVNVISKSENTFANASAVNGSVSAEKEMSKLEEDGGMTMMTLVVLGLIVIALCGYIVYWFCGSYWSKGYRKTSVYPYYGDEVGDMANDVSTDEMYAKYKRHQYDDDDVYVDGMNEKGDSDWDEDEQLGNHKYHKYQGNEENQGNIGNESDNKAKGKAKKRKKRKKNKNKNKKENIGIMDDISDAVQIDMSVSDCNDQQVGFAVVETENGDDDQL